MTISASATPGHQQVRNAGGESNLPIPSMGSSPAPFPPTRRQLELLRFIEGYLETRGYAPDFANMKHGMGIASNSSIHRLLTGLEERGWIKRRPLFARAIEVLHPPAIPYDHNGRPLYFVRL